MKNKKVFIAYDFSNREKYTDFHRKLKIYLENKDNQVYSLVFDKQPKFKDDKDMMNKALSKIKQSDVLIAELSTKQIGIGLEVGYAKALKKEIIYIRQLNSEFSKTVSGVANLIIEYQNIDDLIKKIP